MMRIFQRQGVEQPASAIFATGGGV